MVSDKLKILFGKAKNRFGEIKKEDIATFALKEAAGSIPVFGQYIKDAFDEFSPDEKLGLLQELKEISQNQFMELSEEIGVSVEYLRDLKTFIYDACAIQKADHEEIKGLLLRLINNQTKFEIKKQKAENIYNVAGNIINLNPNTGKKVIIEEIIHVPMLYYRESRDSCYREEFEADELNVETIDHDNSKWFMAFLVKLKFHNDERDTTIHQISLIATEKKNITTIPDMIKKDSGKWENFDIDEFICRIDKNTTNRLYFRFISRVFFDEPEVLIKLALNHTSGIIEFKEISKFMKAEAIDDIKWAEGSSNGNENPTVVNYYNPAYIPFPNNSYKL